MPQLPLKNGVLTLRGGTIAELPDGSWTITSGRDTFTLTVAQVNSIQEIKVQGPLTTSAAAFNNEDFKVTGTGKVIITGGTQTEAVGAIGAESNITLTGIDFANQGAFSIDKSEVETFITRWENLDDLYTLIAGLPNGVAAQFGNYTDSTPLASPILGYNTLGAAAFAVNAAFVKLAIDYTAYLENGGAAIVDFTAKASVAGRDQSIHDNILGNITSGALSTRFDVAQQNEFKLQFDADWLDRPLFTGNPGNDQSPTYIFDYQHGVDRSDYIKTVVDGRVDARAIAANGDLFTGDGHTVNSFAIWSHEGEDLEIAFNGIIRQGPDANFTVESDGVHFIVPAGTQKAAWGSQVDNANRAAWNANLSITDNDLQNKIVKIGFDGDKSTGENYTWLTGTFSGVDPAGDNAGWVFYNENGDAVITDFEGSAQTIQQSFNAVFGYWLPIIDNNANQPGIQTYNLGPAELALKVEVYEQKPIFDYYETVLIGQSEVHFDVKNFPVVV